MMNRDKFSAELEKIVRYLQDDFAEFVNAAYEGGESVGHDTPAAFVSAMVPKFEQAKELRAKPHMLKLVDEFKDFVSDSMDEGMHSDFPDHMEFLEACMNTFIEMKNSEEK